MAERPCTRDGRLPVHSAGTTLNPLRPKHMLPTNNNSQMRSSSGSFASPLNTNSKTKPLAACYASPITTHKFTRGQVSRWTRPSSMAEAPPDDAVVAPAPQVKALAHREADTKMTFFDYTGRMNDCLFDNVVRAAHSMFGDNLFAGHSGTDLRKTCCAYMDEHRNEPLHGFQSISEYALTICGNDWPSRPQSYDEILHGGA